MSPTFPDLREFCQLLHNGLRPCATTLTEKCWKTNLTAARISGSFNLGVEIGQLAIVSLFLPVAYSLRRSRFYQGAVMKLGSGLIALLAGGWLLQRVFDWKILPI